MHVDIDVDLGRTFTPHCALLVYKDDLSGHLLAEHHPAFAVGAEFHVGEAHPLTGGDVRELLTGLGATALQFVPEHAVAVSSVAVAWWSPAQPRPLFFHSHADASVNALSGQVFPQPPLLWIARRGQLTVYALAGNARPGADTPLMCAPFFNVFPSHGVCQGTTPYPDHVDAARVREWETAFFGSNFTHHAAGARRLTTFGGSHTELWQAAQAAGAFDPAWLVPAGCTLAEALA